MPNNYGAVGEALVRGANGPLPQAPAAPELTDAQQAQQLQQQQAAQQALINNNNPNMPTYGTDQAAGVPLNQQTMGYEKPRMDVQSHAPVAPPTFVPGVGMMGPDLGGYVKGDMMRQEFNLKANADSRAESDLGLNKENFGLKKDYLQIAQEQLGISKAELGMKAESVGLDNQVKMWDAYSSQKKIGLDQGMQQAASQGGFAGVVDYLKTADPSMAMAFQAKKLELDDSIMKNEVAQNLQPALKANALLQGYGVLGKVGQAIMKAKSPEEAEAIHKISLPISRSIDPGMSENLDADSKATYMMAIAQGTPENMLYDNNSKALTAQSKVGKLLADRASYVKAGYDPQGPEIKQLDTEVSKLNAQSDEAVTDAQKARLNIGRTQQVTRNSMSDQTQKMQESLDTLSKGFNKFSESTPALYAAFDALDKDPNNVQAQGQLASAFVKMQHAGVATEPDYQHTVGQTLGYDQIEKTLLGYTIGSGVVLNSTQRANLKANFQKMENNMMANQLVREDQIKSDATFYGSPNKKADGTMEPAILNADQINYPSEVLKQQKLVYSNGFQDEDPATRQLVGKYLMNGTDPNAIKDMLVQKRAQDAQQAGQSFVPKARIGGKY